MRSGLRRVVRLAAINVAVTAVLLVVTLLGVELYLRVTIPSSSKESIYQSTLATRRYKVMKPDFRITAWGSEFRTNNLGFRDARADVPPKSASGYRVVVLGDSFTAAAGVDFDKIFTTLLEQNLRQRLGDADVINLAVGGYNIVQYELVLNEVGLALQPDVVVVAAFPFNDLSNETYDANREDAEGRSRPTRRSWVRDLYVYQAFLSRVEARLRNMLARPATGVSSRRAEKGPSAAEENLAALDRIVATATSRGIPALVVLLPNTDEADTQREMFAPFLSRCAAQRWHCLDLLEQFTRAGADLSRMRLNLLDPHPDAVYHAKVAEFLREPVTQTVASVQAERRGRQAAAFVTSR